MIDLRTEMFAAHGARVEAALMDMQAAVIAPALFTPAWTERAQAEYNAGTVGMNLWSA